MTFANQCCPHGGLQHEEVDPRTCTIPGCRCLGYVPRPRKAVIRIPSDVLRKALAQNRGRIRSAARDLNCTPHNVRRALEGLENR